MDPHEWYEEDYQSHLAKAGSSDNASTRTEFNAASPGGRKVSKTGRLDAIFGEPGKKKNKEPLREPSHSFSADGQSILLWTKDDARIFFYDIDSGTWESRPAISVAQAAAGPSFYTYIAKNGNVIYLRFIVISQG